MAAVFKVGLIHLLGRIGKFPTRQTDSASLRTLINSLHPVDSGRPLVRLGPAEDGGYLVPDDLEGIEACFSPGVSTVSGFERQCAERGMQVYMADASVDGPAEQHPRFHFSKKFIGAWSSGEFLSLDAWVQASVPSTGGDLLLQIDIEGFEYEALLATSESLLRRFRVVVAEFHSLDQLWSRPFFDLASRAFGKLLATHACVHIHPNNRSGSLVKQGIEIPPTMEFTFLRRDRCLRTAPRSDFPHPLDADNTDRRPMTLPECWYSSE
jgi:hypothetical protein